MAVAASYVRQIACACCRLTKPIAITAAEYSSVNAAGRWAASSQRQATAALQWCGPQGGDVLPFGADVVLAALRSATSVNIADLTIGFQRFVAIADARAELIQRALQALVAVFNGHVAVPSSPQRAVQIAASLLENIR